MMRCPLCQSPTRLASSTPIATGAVEHVRVCMRPKGHEAIEFKTIEALAGVVSNMGSMKLGVALQTAIRGERARALTARRRVRVRDLLAQGWSTNRIAGDLEVTPARVRQLVAEIRGRDATLAA